MTIKTLTLDSLHISLPDLLEETGTADATFQAEASQLLDEVGELLRPRFAWFVSPELPAFELGTIIERQLKGSQAYACFVCTAGEEYQAYQDRLMAEGDMVRVFIADALGSLIAERTADAMEQSLQSSIDKLHWHRTNRFSPGYCGWHVSQQQTFFRHFHEQPLPPNTTLGVHLTPSSLMIPIKSVSGIIGLGEQVRYHPYTCGICNKKDCYKRKSRQ